MTIVVEPKSRREIISIANDLRMRTSTHEFLDIRKFLEYLCYDEQVNLNFQILNDSDPRLKKAYARFLPVENKIIIRQSVYDSANIKIPRHRFTIAHEIGHSIFHNLYSLSFARNVSNNVSVKAYENPEWQANEFAANLLLPLCLIKNNDSIEYLVKKFGVSKQVAGIQLNKKYKLKL